MSSKLSVQERLMFDQIIEDFDRPSVSASPTLRLLLGLAIVLCGTTLIIAAIETLVLAFIGCLIVAAGGTIAVHARIRLGAFPNAQLPSFTLRPQRPQFRPSPGRPHRF